MKSIIISAVVIFLLSSAFVFYGHNQKPVADNFGDRELRSTDYKKYWERGKAEISRFNLEQARYGEIHKGEAVFIFVHEPFLPKTQVKYDGISTEEEAITVLKLISTRNFFTGLYPYSIMTTVFTPVFTENNTPLKITTSSQDWCGQSYMQINNRGGGYDVEGYSYFQSEGDRDFKLDGAFLEDEIWNRIRINPESLPVGEIEIVPSTKFIKLSLQDIEPQKASAGIVKMEDKRYPGISLTKYDIDYLATDRKIQIMFESEFPHRILEWKEKQKDKHNGSGYLTTKATYANELFIDYWNHSSIADSTYRQELKLSKSQRQL